MSSIAFINPLALIGLIVIPVIIALYFLKLRRRELVIPSTLLWSQVLSDVRANTPFQRLRASLLLLLQIIAALLITLALARPSVLSSDAASDTIVMLVDTSASMATTDAVEGRSASRLQEALTDLRKRVRSMRPSEKMLIAAFDDGVYDATDGFLSEPAELERFIDRIKIRHYPTNFNKALEQIATRIGAIDAMRWRESELVALSDGAFGGIDLNAQDSDHPLRTTFVGYGSTATSNIGIVDIVVRRKPPAAGEKTGSAIIIVTVENFSARPVEVAVTLSLLGDGPAAGVQLGARSVALGSQIAGGQPDDQLRAGAVKDVIFEPPPEADGLFLAELRIEDQFDIDNRAYAIVPKLQGTHGLFVGNTRMGDRANAMRHPLYIALSHLEDVAITTMTADEYRAAPPSPDQYDVAVFNGVRPDSLDAGAALLINVVPPLPGFEAIQATDGNAARAAVEIIDWDNTHPAFYYSRYRQITILSALTVKTPRDARVLLRASNGPLIVSTATDHRRTLSTFFDPLESDWILSQEFMLFVQGAVEWLSDASIRLRGAMIKTGEPLELMPVPGAAPGETRAIVVTRPDGGQTRIDAAPKDGSSSAGDATLIGVYRAEGEGADQLWCANFLRPAESANAARDTITVTNENIERSASAAIVRREIWAPLLGAAIAVLLLEWLTYHIRR
ncbi:MAG: VWA domain-containing protein [Planctomycetota bacterium]